MHPEGQPLPIRREPTPEQAAAYRDLSEAVGQCFVEKAEYISVYERNGHLVQELDLEHENGVGFSLERSLPTDSDAAKNGTDIRIIFVTATGWGYIGRLTGTETYKAVALDTLKHGVDPDESAETFSYQEKVELFSALYKNADLDLELGDGHLLSAAKAATFARGLRYAVRAISPTEH